MSDTDNLRDFNGNWQVTESDNFEEFLCATGAPWIVRKVVTRIKPMTEISQEEGKFHLKIHLLAFSREESFEIGIEFEVKQPNGAVDKGVAEWDGNKLVIEYKPVNGMSHTQTITRELVDINTMHTTMTTNGVTAKRIAVRVES